MFLDIQITIKILIVLKMLRLLIRTCHNYITNENYISKIVCVTCKLYTHLYKKSLKSMKIKYSIIIVDILIGRNPD